MSKRGESVMRKCLLFHPQLPEFFCPMDDDALQQENAFKVINAVTEPYTNFWSVLGCLSWELYAKHAGLDEPTLSFT